MEVAGKHGNLKRDFKHLPIEIFLSDGGKKVISLAFEPSSKPQVVARMYFAKSKQCSMLNTVCSHIANLFEGVTKKFECGIRPKNVRFSVTVYRNP